MLILIKTISIKKDKFKPLKLAQLLSDVYLDLSISLFVHFSAMAAKQIVVNKNVQYLSSRPR